MAMELSSVFLLPRQGEGLFCSGPDLDELVELALHADHHLLHVLHLSSFGAGRFASSSSSSIMSFSPSFLRRGAILGEGSRVGLSHDGQQVVRGT